MADTNLNIVIRAQNLAGRAFSTLTNQMQRVRRLAANVARTVARIGFVGGAIGLAGLATGFVIAAKRAAEFRSGLKEIQTLGVDATIEMLETDIIALSRAFGQQPTSATKAFYDAVSAGVGNAADVTRFLAIAAKAAVAGVSDLATASDALSSVMNAYGIAVDNANTISDAFFGAIRFGKTTFGELASAIGQVAPTAAAAGVSLNDLLLTLSAVTKGGISTDEAATGLKAIFTSILKPSKDAQEAASRLGLSFDATALQAKGLVQFLIDVAKATGGSIEQMTALFPNIRALGPALALAAKDARLLRDGIASFEDVSGSAGRAFRVFVRDNPGFVFKQMQQDISALFLAIGVKLLPVFKPFIELIRDSSNELREFIQSTDISGVTGGIADFLDRQGERITDFIKIIRGFIQGDEETRAGIVQNLRAGLKETFLGAWAFFVSIIKQGAAFALAPVKIAFFNIAVSFLDTLSEGLSDNVLFKGLSDTLDKTAQSFKNKIQDLEFTGGPTFIDQSLELFRRASKEAEEVRAAARGRFATGARLRGEAAGVAEAGFADRPTRAQRRIGRREILLRERLERAEERVAIEAERFFERPEDRRGGGAGLRRAIATGQRLAQRIETLDASINVTFQIDRFAGSLDDENELKRIAAEVADDLSKRQEKALTRAFGVGATSVSFGITM